MAADSECDLHNTFERGAFGAAETGLGHPGLVLNDGPLAAVLPSLVHAFAGPVPCDVLLHACKPVACRHRAGPPGAP
jgi:hypothetical protein